MTVTLERLSSNVNILNGQACDVLPLRQLWDMMCDYLTIEDDRRTFVCFILGLFPPKDFGEYFYARGVPDRIIQCATNSCSRQVLL